jgi:cytochrome c oxidase subunit I+III
MTDARAQSPAELHRELDRVWGTPPGLGRLSAVNHNIVGRRYLAASLAFFLIGGLLAMLLRVQLATSRSAFLDAPLYDQIFTMHGVIMMFLFAIPLFTGLAMYLLPKMLGARDVIYPRLSAYSFWCYLFGGSILIIALLLGVAPNAGWFMYPPLSSRPYNPGVNSDVWLIGVTFVEISGLAGAIEIVVTVLKTRAPGMSLDRMPLFAWYMLVTALMMLLAFPPLIVGSVLLETERVFGYPFFDPERGGDPLLWQHLFWLFGHPEVYIIFLPAAGVVSTILPTLSRREIVGYRWIVVSIVALAFLSFGLWVHHMYSVGVPHFALGLFSAASMAVAVPTSVQIFAWIATLATGRPQLRIPMLYLFGFFFNFVLGGLTGVMVAVVPFDWQAHDTHFIVAHLHYVLIGGFVFPMLAAAYYWLPHFTGRAPVLSLGVVAFWLIFIGFNLTFLIMHWTGLIGMPRRVFTYESGLGWDLPNFISSVGAFVMAIGFAVFVTDLLVQVRFGKRIRRNPWWATTLEWTTPTPPPYYNFAAIPAVASRTPLRHADLIDRVQKGEGYLGFVRNDWLETIGVDMIDGRVEQIVILPKPTFLPLYSAIATGVFFLSALFGLYGLALAGAVATAFTFLLWSRASGLRQDHGPLPVGRGEQAPPHTEVSGSPAWWGAVFAVVADVAAFASLASGLFFLWISAPAWPPREFHRPDAAASIVAAAALVAAAWSARRAIAANRVCALQRRGLWLILTAAIQALAFALLFVVALAAPDPTRHAYAAVTMLLLAYCCLHCGIAFLFAVMSFARACAGHVSAARWSDLRVARLWQDYAAAVGLATLAILWGAPWLMK